MKLSFKLLFLGVFSFILGLVLFEYIGELAGIFFVISLILIISFVIYSGIECVDEKCDRITKENKEYYNKMKSGYEKH